MALTITLYNFSKRINSTKVPEGGVELSATLKGGSSIINPSLLISTDNDKYNMFKFGSRYYWITDMTWVRDDLLQITGEVDALASWKSDINATTAFVSYSSSSYDALLVDGRLDSQSRTRRKTNTTSLGSPFNSEGSFILGVIGSTQKPNAGGFINVYNMTQRECADLSVFFSTDVDAITRVKEQFGNAFGCLSYLKWIPIAQQGQDLSQIYIGNEASGIFGSLLESRHLFKQVFIPIPWFSSDFRRYEPYSHATLYLPFVGNVTLSLQDLAEIITLTVNAVFDMYTGEIVYSIINSEGIMAVYKGDASVDLPMSTYQSNVTSKLGIIDTASSFGVETGAGVGLGASAIAKYAGDMAQDVSKGLQMITPMKAGMIGGFSGSAGSRLGTDLMLSIYTHDTSDSPGDLASTIGRPCNAIKTIGSLSGFVQCAQFKVGGNMTATEKNMINGFMTGGVYLE